MSLAEPFPDIEKALMDGLPGLLVLPAGHTARIATDFIDAPKRISIRLTLIDDPRDRVTRVATVSVEIFGTSRTVVYDVAQQVAGLLVSVRRLGGVVIDKVETPSGPIMVPWDNPDIRRATAKYRISTRR